MVKEFITGTNGIIRIHKIKILFEHGFTEFIRGA